jgi:hypothetical protein
MGNRQRERLYPDDGGIKLKRTNLQSIYLVVEHGKFDSFGVQLEESIILITEDKMRELLEAAWEAGYYYGDDLFNGKTMAYNAKDEAVNEIISDKN